MIRMLQQEVAGFSRLNISNVSALYRFDDNVLDSVGANHGTYIGVNNYTNGLINKSLDLPHNSSYVTIPNNPALSFTNGTNDIEKTISFLYKFDTSSGSKYLLSKRENANGTYYLEWGIYYDGVKLTFIMWDNATIGSIAVSYVFTPIVNQYYSIKCGYDGGGLRSGMWISLNGNRVYGVDSSTTYNKSYNFNQYMTIGVNSWAKTQRSHGEFDELQFWDINMTESEAAYSAQQELNGIAII